MDEELDEKKRFYDGIGDLLSEVAREIAEMVPANLGHDLNVIYFPQIGFLIAMPMVPETGRSLWEGTEENVWEKMFSSDTVVYYKSSQMKEMDDHFGDIYGEICGKQTLLSIVNVSLTNNFADKEIDIVYELVQRVLEFEELLATVSDICGELDW